MIRVALLASFVLCIASQTSAQTPKKPPVTKSALCTRDIAVDNTKQQILFTRTFDLAVPRIAVLLRAADLLWPYEQDKALAAFMEAFDLAVQNYKEQGDQVRRTSSSQFAAVIAVPDQRYKVIGALARRDPAAARKLSNQMLKDDAQAVVDKSAVDKQARTKAAEKILSVAVALIPTDATIAADFARESFNYPATLSLPIFIYSLAKTHQLEADLLYEEALLMYGGAPMDQFLYLSAYPFGNNREAGEMPAYTFYRIPDGFVPNTRLQRQFVRRLLARAQGALEVADVQSTAARFSDPAQMWLALTRLEKQIQTNLPTLADETAQAKDKLYTLLNPATQNRASGMIVNENKPKRTFDELVEAAEKVADVGVRDRDLTTAITGNSKNETVERVVSVVDKISDSGVRNSLLNWFYFFRTQALLTDKKIDEARALAAKVNELDQRAYLFSRIAEESLKETEDQTRAREMLNELAAAVAKAPKTIVSARTLLALAYLYAKIDVNRGVEELGNAVKTINALESPDFSQQFVTMKIEGKTFGSFASFQTPGFNPENAFREMGKLDFDGSLTNATTFADKSLRALTTLAVIEPCLEVAPAKPATKKTKP
ncbi:MAG TPA: hypothetical protein VFB65_17205 [Pyrinomonadaceae bacterium]|nr:hypothetical protein [Pyrinomonadaceae bacterium]